MRCVRNTYTVALVFLPISNIANLSRFIIISAKTITFVIPVIAVIGGKSVFHFGSAASLTQAVYQSSKIQITFFLAYHNTFWYRHMLYSRGFQCRNGMLQYFLRTECFSVGFLYRNCITRLFCFIFRCGSPCCFLQLAVLCGIHTTFRFLANAIIFRHNSTLYDFRMVCKRFYSVFYMIQFAICSISSRMPRLSWRQSMF